MSASLQPGSHHPSNAFMDGPRLLADIGGTNARFALERAPGQIDTIQTLRCADYAEFSLAVKAYLEGNQSPAVKHAAIAIANPVHGDQIKMTNHHWAFSIEQTRRLLGFDTLLVVNDFTALSMALPHLEQTHCVQIGGGAALEGSVIGLVGAGTGLGVGGLIPSEGRWIALGSEGGHASFSPNNEREAAILHYCWRTFTHVSAERLISGPGLETIYNALCDIDQVVNPAPLSAAQIVERALRSNDALCVEVIDCFCGMLGTLASNVAVTLGTLGGIYIGGGVVPHLGEYFARSAFRARFESKGRFSSYMEKIPTFVITAPYPAFVGVAAILAERLGGGNAVPFLERIRKARSQFSPAEERVASLILAHPRAVMSEPISEIARRANVSQPTVIRFCRTMGCQGLADFKLKLASGVTGTVPVSHSQVHVGDSSLDVGVKVVDNTIAAMMEVRDSLNSDTLAKVIEVLSHATRIEFYGFGSCGLVAEDAQQKFFRLGIPSTAYTDPQLQEVSASLLKNTDVAVIISNSGRLRHLATTVEVAVNSGATIIALAPSNSQLAKRADYTLAVEHDEGSTMHIPMVSRILMLLLVDVLAVGVSLNRSSPFAELQRQAKRGILAHIASARDALGDKVSAASEATDGEDGGKPNLISHTK
ncbi:glucokinase [Herbaspirillum sp. Sphag1AN]|uniref:glucokinase n=1 Tax=unclassified Herbaspirillum TaxID=2624150 RepID=UPI00180B928A|nr:MULTISPECIES: glucokinase [unclassified Herbaspirillum]MBB3214873.1 glucokinase [Herbaspirillum sp. Sphag1AN]MBB3248067.1 glucokinase [Herbaspirillum sp. Sphag64]